MEETNLPQHKERLESLEAVLNNLPSISNEVVIPIEDNGTVVYVGQAYHLQFSSTNKNIEGYASLTKYARSKEIIIHHRLASLIPFRIETIGKEVDNDKKLWSVADDSRWRSTFIYNEKTTDSYRHDLVNTAAEQGLQFSSQLLDRVFGPIDAKLLEAYRNAVRFRYT